MTAPAADPSAAGHAPLRDPLVWVDLEMTGLDPDRDRIVEIAVIVTDGALERVLEGPDLVLGADEDALQGMDQFVVDMHTSSGLLERIRASDLGLAQAEDEVLRFVQRYVPSARQAPLAGNSIHVDRSFLRVAMPRLDGYLHYRNVDVSTVKELARRWYPDVLGDAPEKATGHRALQDIRESIDELRWFRERIFVPPA